MATAAVESIPSYNRVEPGSNQLKAATYPEVKPVAEANVKTVVSDWLHSLNDALSHHRYEVLKQFFLPESCWRDQLGLSWDYHTLQGPEKIISFLKTTPKGPRIESLEIDNTNSTRQPSVAAVDFKGNVNGIASFLTVETDVGRGRGMVRLLQDQKDGKWKAFTLFTAMLELKGHEETVKRNRPQGVDHGGQPGRKNWQQRRDAMANFEGGNGPTVLILGQPQRIVSFDAFNI